MILQKEKAWFSNTDEGEGCDYEYARSLDLDNDTDLIELIGLLRNRLQGILIDQSEILNSKDGKIYKGASFPLAVMTCIGIETLGNIFFKENKDKKSYQFLEGIKLVDSKFGRKIKEKEKELLESIWGDSFKKTKVDTMGGLVYSYFRNTMIHGYRGKGVFLSFRLQTLTEFENGYLVLNPNIFWEKFKKAFDKQFSDIVKGGMVNQKSSRVKALKRYLDDLINK